MTSVALAEFRAIEYVNPAAFSGAILREGGYTTTWPKISNSQRATSREEMRFVSSNKCANEAYAVSESWADQSSDAVGVLPFHSVLCPSYEAEQRGYFLVFSRLLNGLNN